MTAIEGPNIVTNGLVLHLDAANAKSYPRSGTLWSDLSSSRNNGTLFNSPVFNSANGGYFSFNGIDNYSISSTSVVTGNNPFTVCGFFRRTGSTSGKSAWGIGGNANLRGINTFSTGVNSLLSMDLWGISTFQAPVSSDLNQWNFCAWVYRGTVFSRQNVSIYKNSVEYSGTNLTISRGNETSIPDINSSGTVIAKADTLSNNYYGPFDIGFIFFYNIALSSAEIQRNFDSSRGRYGI